MNKKQKLTKAQQREYDLVKKHGSVYIVDGTRRNIYYKLQEMGLVDLSGNWFSIIK